MISTGHQPAEREPARWVIQLRRGADDRVEGVLSREGAGQGVPFSGWLDLLWRLEAAIPAAASVAPED